MKSGRVEYLPTISLCCLFVDLSLRLVAEFSSFHEIFPLFYILHRVLRNFSSHMGRSPIRWTCCFQAQFNDEAFLAFAKKHRLSSFLVLCWLTFDLKLQNWGRIPGSLAIYLWTQFVFAEHFFAVLFQRWVFSGKKHISFVTFMLSLSTFEIYEFKFEFKFIARLAAPQNLNKFSGGLMGDCICLIKCLSNRRIVCLPWTWPNNDNNIGEFHAALEIFA